MFNFNRNEKGQGLVEYALILVLIAIVVIVAMTTLGNQVSGTFDTVNSELGGNGGGGNSPSPTAVPTNPPARIEGDAARTQYCNERPGYVGVVNWGFAGGHEWTTDGQSYYVTGAAFNCPYP